MLWKQPYETRISRDVWCPVSTIVTLDGQPLSQGTQVWIGGFGFDAITDQGVWWRLFGSDFPNDPAVRKVFVLPKVSTNELQTAVAVIPRSEAARCLLIEDPHRAWHDLINPDTTERGFAAIVEDGKIALLMVGPPTEEAWENFANEWKLRT